MEPLAADTAAVPAAGIEAADTAAVQVLEQAAAELAADTDKQAVLAAVLPAAGTAELLVLVLVLAAELPVEQAAELPAADTVELQEQLEQLEPVQGSNPDDAGQGIRFHLFLKQYSSHYEGDFRSPLYH